MSNFHPEALTQLPEGVQAILHCLHQAGHPSYLVGGAVRDHLRGQATKDFDLATRATPEQVAPLFERVIATGLKHGTLTVLSSEALPVEITTFRAESAYSDGRHPDQVRYVATIEEDLGRRDFTINAMALRHPDGLLVDPFDGQGDLKAGLVRAVGEADQRFREDGLRLLRAARFAATLGFAVELQTRAAMARCAEALRNIAAERQREELCRLLQAPVPSAALRLLRETGLLAILLPEMVETYDFSQNAWHQHDVFEHTLAVLDAAPAESLPLRLAALCHDLGKPATAAGPADQRSFHNHEIVSAERAQQLMQRLRFSGELSQKVESLVASHMWHYSDDWSDGAVRRFIVRVGGEAALDEVFALRRADLVGRGSTGLEEGLQASQRLQQRCKELLSAAGALSVRDLALDGHQVMQLSGLQPGPPVGALLEWLLEAVLDQPELNTEEGLRALLEAHPRKG